MDDLYISWDFFDARLFAPVKGTMMIHLDIFFPCPLDKFKKLLKVVEMDSHDKELKEKLKVYFQNRVSALKAELGESEKTAATLMVKIETGKYENGVRIPKGKMKEYRQQYQEIFSDIKRDTRQIKQFERYLQFV